MLTSWLVSEFGKLLQKEQKVSKGIQLVAFSCFNHADAQGTGIGAFGCDIRCILAPLDFSQTKTFIEQQIAYSGHTGPIFSEDAMKMIYDFSSGVPRLINRACTQALIYAYQNRRAIIDDRMVQIVLEGEVT